MLFDADDDGTQYNDGLFEDDSPTIQQEQHTAENMRQAALGITRTNTGIRIGSPAPMASTELNDELYIGSSGSIIGSNEWVTITSSDLFTLRLLGVGV